MAKKKNVSKIEEIPTFTVTPEPKDPLADKVKALREKGFNDNIIASMLMIHSQTVKEL